MATFPFTNDPLSQVEMIYIAYFGRAGDPMGTNFWVNELTASGDTIVPGMTGVAAAFSQQPEAMAQYPLLANPQGASQADIQTFINAIYQNLFDRSADQKGLAFWTNEVNTILATGDPLQIANGIGQMAVSIALGAQGNDQTLLANKVAVSDLLTEIFSEDSINTFPNPSALFTFAHTDIAGVGASEASVIAAEIAATAFEGVFPIPNAGGAPDGAAINWPQFADSTFNYAQFVSPQFGPLTILNAPSTFTLDTQHYGDSFPTGEDVISAAGNGNLFTLILGNNTGPDGFGGVAVVGYPTVSIVANGGIDFGIKDIVTNLVITPPAHSTGQLVISGSGSLFIGDVSSSGHEGIVTVAVSGGTITDVGVQLLLGATDAETIDASQAPVMQMSFPVSIAEGVLGVTILGGSAEGNDLQGSLGGLNTVGFSNGITTGQSATIVGTDNITAGPVGNDGIFGDGGPDTIVLPPDHSMGNGVYFGCDLASSVLDVLAITDGSDRAHPGFWGVTEPTAIPTLFSDPTGGTSADITTITGFRAGSGGDLLNFDATAWNGRSTPLVSVAAENGDLVGLDGGSIITTSLAQLSAVWINSGSNSNNFLQLADNVLRYAPSDASVQNAQQLATQLHTSSDAVVLPGAINAGQDVHILVAYAAGNNAVNIADVDLVNTSASNQTSTANLHVYASDMVHLTGVSLMSLTPDNIDFILS